MKKSCASAASQYQSLRDKMRREIVMATQETELTGKVVNGVIVLENGQSLPDGTLVRVEPVTEPEAAQSVSQVSELREMLLSHAGVLGDSDLPADLAQNLDHYLYGTPKVK
jgi:energy-coupling factor transporter ATP-binding protein EcfA2